MSRACLITHIAVILRERSDRRIYLRHTGNEILRSFQSLRMTKLVIFRQTPGESSSRHSGDCFSRCQARGALLRNDSFLKQKIPIFIRIFLSKHDQRPVVGFLLGLWDHSCFMVQVR